MAPDRGSLIHSKMISEEWIQVAEKVPGSRPAKPHRSRNVKDDRGKAPGPVAGSGKDDKVKVDRDARPAEDLREPEAAYAAVSERGPTATGGDKLGDDIDQLYDRIAALAQEPGISGSDPRLAAAWARLRQLQNEEARRFRLAFEASLAMPLDAGAQVLSAMSALRRELEDSAAPDPAARRSDPSTP